MKKFIVRDEDNKEFEVEEMEEVKTDDVDATKKDEEPASLSETEIDALKKLASVSDKLIALIEAKDGCGEESGALDDDDDKDEDEDKDDDDEEIVDTDEDKKLRNDSVKSVGAIEKTKSKDSLADDHEIEVANAWAKRYGGNK